MTTFRTLLATLLAIALLAWFLHDANLADVWTQVAAARLDLLALALAFVALTYVVRTVRWQYLLAPIAPTTFRNTFRATVIGFAALSILPARAGDLLRPYLLARREGLSAPATFATVIMERVLDLVAVLTLLAVFVWGFADASTLPGSWRGIIEGASAVAAAAAAGMLTLMWVLASHPERIGTLVLAAGRVLPRTLAERLADLARTFSGGFVAATKPRALGLGIIWSFPLWLTIAGEAWAVTRAFGIEMSFPGSFLLQAWLVIGVAVPTPGAVGGFHAAYRFAVTTFFGAPDDQAVAAAILVHAMSFLPVILIGVLFMAQDGLSVGRLREMAGEAREEDLPHGGGTAELGSRAARRS